MKIEEGTKVSLVMRIEWQAKSWPDADRELQQLLERTHELGDQKMELSVFNGLRAGNFEGMAEVEKAIEIMILTQLCQCESCRRQRRMRREWKRKEKRTAAVAKLAAGGSREA